MTTDFRFDELDLREEPFRGDAALPGIAPPSDNPQCCSSATALTL